LKSLGYLVHCEFLCVERIERAVSAR